MSDGTGEVFISFFVACYNEQPNIYATLGTLTSALSDCKFSYEIIVIDDASWDGSPAEVRRFQNHHPDVPVGLVVRERNLGLALNFVEGAFAARGIWYRLVCGDNVESVDTLRAAFAAAGTADMVITYPSRREGFSAMRNLISKTYTKIVNLISGHDIRYYNSPTIHRRANVLRWHSRSRGFSFQADLITQLLDRGATYVEIPVVATERVNGQSTALSLRNFLSVAHSLVEMGARRLRRRLFGDNSIEAPQKPPRAGNMLWLKLLVSAALLGALAMFANLSATFDVIGRVERGLLLLAALTMTLQVLLGALRWKIILSLGDADVHVVKLTRINLIASFLGQALPAGIGTDGARILLLRRQGVGTARAVAAAVLDRAFLLAVLLAACGLSFLTMADPANMGANRITLDWIGGALLALTPAPVVGLLALNRLGRSGIVGRRIDGAGEVVAGPIRRILLRPGKLVGLAALSFVTLSNLALCAYLLALGLHAPISFVDIWLVIAPALLAASLPISLGGWGVRELTLVSGLGYMGVPSAEALSLSLLFGLCGVLGTLPGLPLWLAKRREDSANAVGSYRGAEHARPD